MKHNQQNPRYKWTLENQKIDKNQKKTEKDTEAAMNILKHKYT
nr:hypothetical protein [Mycoplasmopsis bovis]